MERSKVVRAVKEKLSRKELEKIQRGQLRLIVLEKDYLCRVSFGNFDFCPCFYLTVRNKNKHFEKEFYCGAFELLWQN